MPRPVVELSDCVKCEICIDISPAIFRMNDAGFVEIIDLETYQEAEVNDAIKNCPEDCIYWSD